MVNNKSTKSTDIKQSEEILKGIKYIENQQDILLELTTKMLKAKNGELLLNDLFFVGAVNRTMKLLAGIVALLPLQNFTACGALLRMHLDTLMKMSYVAQSNDNSEAVQKFIEGEEFYKMKNNLGERLNDKTLKEYTKKYFPQVETVYKETSRLVHFTDKNVVGAFYGKKNSSMAISKKDFMWDEDSIKSLIGACVSITSVIASILEAWVIVKSGDVKHS